MADESQPVQISIPKKLWEQLEDETPLWYKRFVVFRSIPKSQRSVTEAYRLWTLQQTKKEPKTPKPPTLWREQAEIYRWETRADALDADNVRREELKSQEFVLSVRLSMQEMVWRLIERANEMIKFPIAEKHIEVDEGGNTIIIKPVNFNLGDIPRYLRTAEELCHFIGGTPLQPRTSLGPSDRRQKKDDGAELQVGGVKATRTEKFESMSDEDLSRYVDTLIQEGAD